MSKNHEFVCIVCPVGCRLKVVQDGDNIKVSGNQCKRGEKYAVAELTNPLRMVTSSIKVIGGNMPLTSVKTKDAIPKKNVDKVLEEIKNKSVSAPVRIGDVLIKNVASTGIDVIATRNIAK